MRDMRAFDGGEKLTGKEKNDFARGLKQGIISAIVHKDLSGRVPVLVRGHRERGGTYKNGKKDFYEHRRRFAVRDQRGDV